MWLSPCFQSLIDMYKYFEKISMQIQISIHISPKLSFLCFIQNDWRFVLKGYQTEV